VLGSSIFGSSGFGAVLSRLLILMVLSSAAASTQTTILPTARTTLSMAVYKSIPKAFAKVHRKHLTPTVSTMVMGGVSIVLYVIMNSISAGSVIADSVTALGVMIAFYYGLTGIACVWYYRKTLTKTPRNFFMQGVLPFLGWAIMWSIGGFSLVQDWGTGSSFTSWSIPGIHWHVGGVFLLVIGAALIGVVSMLVYARIRPAFFRGEVLNANTPTLVPESEFALDTGLPDLHRSAEASPTN
jgi:amino acid transporter